MLATALVLVAACSPDSATPTPRHDTSGITVEFVDAGAPVSSSPIAVSPDGRTIAVVNPDSDSISLIDAASLELLAEAPVGDDPRTLTFTPDGQYVLVANHAGGDVSVVALGARAEVRRWAAGANPYGVVADQHHAYVAGLADRALRVIELASGNAVATVRTEQELAGVALSPAGTELAVSALFTGEVLLFEVANLDSRTAVAATISTGADSNLSQHLAFSQDGGRLYLPQTRSNSANTALVFDATVFPVVNVVDVESESLMIRDRITLDTADQPVSMPMGVALSPDERTLYVVNASSNDVSVIDLESGNGVANVQVGANPRGIVMSPTGDRAFVANVLDGTISVIDTATHTVIASVRTTEIPLDPAVLLGKQLFNAAVEPKLTTDNWISCTVCHFDGTLDKQTWAGFPDGPRNTPSLLGVVETQPSHWSGDLDELADVELTIRHIQAGTGLFPGEAHDSLGAPHAGASNELDALVAFMVTLRVTEPPYESDASAVERGSGVFNAQSCDRCHTPPLYTDRQLHDVGTGDPAVERNSHGRGTAFDTPSLRGLWATEPYLHDGSAATLEDVLSAGKVHSVGHLLSEQELDDLVAFLRSLH